MMTRSSAETVALSALAWLAANDALWPMFMGASGVEGTDLRARAGDADFLASVLDFILMDDAWVIDCAGAQHIAPERIAHARAALPGGVQVHWT